MARKRKQPASAAGTPKQPQPKRQEQSEPPPQEQELVAEEQTPTTQTVEHHQQQPEEDNPAIFQQAEDAEEVGEEQEEEAEEEEDEEEEEEEVEEEEEEEVEEQEEVEVEEGNQIANGVEPPPKSQSDSQPAAAEKLDDRDGASSGGGGVENDDDEPIPKLLDPFSKEQIFNLLLEAAEKHADVADRIRRVADEDPVHRKIFVHGLGWDTTAETLVTVFGQYGPIEDCKAVSDKISGKSKGYGFILFKSRKGARKALEQPQKKIGNRMTACQLASMGPVPASAGAAASQPPSALAPPVQPVSEYTLRKIYVSNVSSELDPQKLLVFFAKFGEIEEGPLGLDKYTGKPKGFCLFVYRSPESAKKALEEPHKNFEGHILHCQKAIDGPKPGKSHSLHHHHSNPQSASFQRGKNLNFTGTAAAGPPTHLMAPSAPGIGLNQQAQTLNPAAVGQALSALLASQGAAGLGFTNLLSTLGSSSGSQGVPGYGTQGVQGGFGNQGVGTSVSPGVMGGYGSQGGYTNQQMGQGGSGRPQHSQHGVGHMGGAPPYMNH